MEGRDRLSPEEALARTREAEDGPPQARLKIFYGMAPGVGKTYAMLEEAQDLASRGVDVWVGWIELHGRPETEALLQGLKRIEPRRSTYRGLALAELDLDEVLARAPEVVVVDEVAHSNAPGSRHPKRYQDVLELLDAGISVLTTVNIQHLESLADSVELLTLAPVRERIPDAFFDRATELRLVDLAPEDLLGRLKEGKVYTGKATEAAIAGFFTRGNLAALRELALHQASLFASHDLLRAPGLAPRILVALGPSPHSQSLLRWARRLSYSLKAETHCVTVETGMAQTTAAEAQLQKNLEFARSLGLLVDRVQNVDPAAGILEFARAQRISILVIGKSGLGRVRPWRRPSLSERILRDSGEIAVFAIQEHPGPSPWPSLIRRPWGGAPRLHYLLALAAVAGVTGLNLGLAGLAGYWAASVPYLALISLLGLFLERGPVFLGAIASALAWDYLFIPPRFTLTIGRLEDWLMLGLYLVLAVCEGWATTRLKANERMLALRERRLSLLGDLAAALAGKSELGDICATGLSFLRTAFGADCLVFLGKEGEEPRTFGPGRGHGVQEVLAPAVAYTIRRGEPSGAGTATLPALAWHLVPLETPTGTIGALAIASRGPWTEDVRILLTTMARTMALAMERKILEDEATAHALAAESERVGRILLDSVSHEFRTPLTVIDGNASLLAAEVPARAPEETQAIAREIRKAARRLDAIVENLLSMNRLESGHLVLQASPQDPLDLMAAAFADLDLEGKAGSIALAPEPNLPLVPCDPGLIVQVLSNLVGNALRYGGSAEGITLSCRTIGESLLFEISDAGPGVAPEDLPRLFGKFYRGSGAGPGGSGLGLSICRGIVEAHGGRIEARQASPHGLVVSFSLPLGDRP